ncbi:MAG: hypothetical protein FJ358_06615 [Thaumarchaeota archaeon]|nr:hypothetical protein [Nitrososphaerota archaeon]
MIATTLAIYFGLPKPNSGQPESKLGISVLNDPSEDVGKNLTFLDVTSAKVALSGGNLSFSVTVAGQIPQSPTSYVAFGWFITSGVTSIDRPIIVLIYDPSVGHWVASVFAGRPPSESTKGLSFTVEGNTATVFVSLQTLDNPSTFTWHVVSRDAPFGIGLGIRDLPGTGTAIDRAPNSGDVNWCENDC